MSRRNIGIISLAAGQGTRLRPLTEDLPKCLVAVAGKPILLHMIASLEDLKKKYDLGISLYLVIGYQAAAVRSVLKSLTGGLDIHEVLNADYETTNNLYSLRLAMDAVRDRGFDRLIWTNGDCLYDTAILAAALADGPNVILCDGRSSYNEESMKIITAGNSILGIGKTVPAGPDTRVSIDCYAFTPQGWARFDRFIGDYCIGPRRAFWAEIALHDFMVAEKAKGSDGIFLSPLAIDGLRWAEIDKAQDLAFAEKLWGGENHQPVES